MNALLLALLLVVVGCTKPPVERSAEAQHPTPTESAVEPPVAHASPEAAVVEAKPPRSKDDDDAVRAAEENLFPGDTLGAARRESLCPRGVPAKARIACLLGLRYDPDAAAKAIASKLFDRYGILVGVQVDHEERMGWRGTIHLVPEPAVGPYRKHLEWIAAAVSDMDDVFSRIDSEHHEAHEAIGYTWHPFVLRTMRSVGRTTPSAYTAFDRWEVSYNVVGSLNTSEEAVRELLVHELFHRNDGAHDQWSARALGGLYRGILRRCGTRVDCLAPYAPTATKVRGGTYYAFQSEDYDSVLEYAAELAVRWYREHRALVKKTAPLPAFKCGPRENREAWDRLVTEFFGGIDRVPSCTK